MSIYDGEGDDKDYVVAGDILDGVRMSLESLFVPLFALTGFYFYQITIKYVFKSFAVFIRLIHEYAGGTRRKQ